MAKRKLIATTLNETEFERVKGYATAKGKTIYGLLKVALFEYIERNP